jgi:hypothetical protein
MPLHFGKIFALIALLTIVAFVLWQLWLAIFAGVAFDKAAALHPAGSPVAALTLAG